MTATDTVVIDLPRKPLDESVRVYLSHSRSESYMSCPFNYYLEYEEGWVSNEEACALGFGSAIHTACAAYLISSITKVACDPVAVFVSEWNKFCRSKVVDYGKQWTKEKLDETGIALIKAFVAWWPTSGFTVLCCSKGNPIVERKFRIMLPGNIQYTAIVDLIARDAKGRVLVLDIKTPAQLSMEGFARLSDQLLGYQIVGDAFKADLGIEQIDGMGFIELHKVTVKDPPKKAGSKPKLQPSVAPVEIADRRPDSEVQEWILERRRIAQDIRTRRFPRRPGSSFNTPCSFCDRHVLCSSNRTTGLFKKPMARSRNKLVTATQNAQAESELAPF